MYLSKSKYCNAIQCNKMLWLEKNMPQEKKDVNNDSVLENGTEVGLLAKKLFANSIDIKYNDDLNEMIKDTKALLYLNNVVITEASFLYDKNFCSVDILEKKGNEYIMYEVKSSTEIHDIYLDDISYQYYILNNLGYNVCKCNIVYINSKYVRHNFLDLKELFIIQDVTDIVLSKQELIPIKIEEIQEYMKQTEEPLDDIGDYCFKPYDCPFFEYCTCHLKHPNVFDIRQMFKSTKMKLYKKDVYKYEDLLKENIDKKYKQQIEYELYDKEDYIDKEKIKEFLNTLSYPMYFLDFETFQQAIPKYDFVSPYGQIPFQYSLHYIDKIDGDLKHTEYLAQPDIDPRRELAKKLVSDIPKNVCTVAYNMQFEKMVIKKLAELYPDLEEHLMNIHDNMKDLMIPFKNRSYYTKDMHGSYSIKYVLPALFKDDESLNYKNLDMIHNGGEAMASYTSLGSKPIQMQEIIRKNLLNYCKLDTYAMVKILMKLREKVE